MDRLLEILKRRNIPFTICSNKYTEDVYVQFRSFITCANNTEIARDFKAYIKEHDKILLIYQGHNIIKEPFDPVYLEY